LDYPKETYEWVSVYEFLKDKIIKGIYSPGEKLSEREIAGLTNVSRTPTREALKILEHEGFVTSIARRGVFVKKYSPEELDVLHRMLIRLEGLAVRMAVPKISGSDLTYLQEVNRRLRSLASRKNYGNYLTLNMEFHFFFPRTTQSRELLDTISQLRKRTFRYSYAQITLAHDAEEYLEDHQEIIDALRGKTNKLPDKIMEKHIERSRKSLLKFYRKFGP
jgi:DNA-binding GntR family transcriptional regulator